MPLDLPFWPQPSRPDGIVYRNAAGIVLRPLSIARDIPLLHGWFTQPYARFWAMQDKTEDDVRRCYQALLASGHAMAYLGLCRDAPAFLLECYDPRFDQVGEHYAVQAGDLGMHVCVAPPTHRIPKFTRTVFRALMDFMFTRLGAQRIVVEPDIDNRKIHALNREMGFVYHAQAAFREKVACIAFCTRHDFERATITFEETDR